METVLFILAKTVAILLEIAYFGMLVRMLLPLFVDTEESVIYAISFFITEPVILPVRYLMYKLNIGQDSPVDWSFLASSLALVVLMMILPPI